MDKKDLIFNKTLLRNKLFSFDSPNRISLKDDFFTPAAVLFAIRDIPNKPYELVVIHRSDKGLKHRGEMSFPGGKFDEKYDKSTLDTALRETEEEIGIPRDEIEILGALHDFPTMSEYIVTPFIGVFNKNLQMVREEREVQAIVSVPIDFFINKKSFREQIFDQNGKKLPVFYFNYKTNLKAYTIWGATAYMIVSFIELVYSIKMSTIGIRRFNVTEIKEMKDFLIFRNKITDNLK